MRKIIEDASESEKTWKVKKIMGLWMSCKVLVMKDDIIDFYTYRLKFLVYFKCQWKKLEKIC